MVTTSSDISSSQFQAAIDLLQERFQPGVILLYGSRASGRSGPGSDVDLAMLFGEAPRPGAFELARARTDLEAILGRDVDLVVLDEASPVLAMQVLRNGKVLVETDPDLLPIFTMQTTGAYFDLKRSRQPVEEALLAS